MALNRLVSSVLVSASLLAAAPVAGAADGNVPINGTVARLCVLGAPNPSAVDVGILIATSGLRLGRSAAIGTQAVTLPVSFCNYPGTMLTVTANALLSSDATPPVSGFARSMNFTATANGWAVAPAAVTTAASAAGATPSATASGGVQNAPKIADVSLVLSNFSVPSDSYLVAGNYAGSVVITLGPSPAGP